MKVIVTGASGLLGSTIIEYLHQQGVEAIAFDRKQFSWNLTEHNSQLLLDNDVIIHTAANTNVEQCEEEPSECYKDNTFFTERLAIAADRAGCKFVYISSTGVYGSYKEAEVYTEYDEVKPTTHHHRAKWLGEQSVKQFCHNALILRAGWIFGGSPLNCKNFVARRLEEATKLKSDEMFSNSDQFGVPTYVKDFSAKLYELLLADEVGTFNLVNSGMASRYEYVSKIIKLSGLNITVKPVEETFFNRKANVSNNESAVNLKLKQLGYEALPLWEVSLKNYINNDLREWLKKIRESSENN